jgi:osmotically-inducible protein OsmY
MKRMHFPVRPAALAVLAVIPCVTTLGGCVAAAAGAAVGGVATAYDRRTTGTVVEDQAIELKAWQALRADEELNEQAHLNVTSFNTRVLLTGEAPTEELRARAADIVRGVDKVSHVYNEVTVAAPSSLMSRSSDTVLTSKVKAKLLADANIDGVHVKVVTENGVVYLMGLVTRADGELAARVASETGGVQKVVKLFQYTD